MPQSELMRSVFRAMKQPVLVTSSEHVGPLPELKPERFLDRWSRPDSCVGRGVEVFESPGANDVPNAIWVTLREWLPDNMFRNLLSQFGGAFETDEFWFPAADLQAVKAAIVKYGYEVHQLPSVTAYQGYEFEHHRALCDQLLERLAPDRLVSIRARPAYMTAPGCMALVHWSLDDAADNVTVGLKAMVQTLRDELGWCSHPKSNVLPRALVRLGDIRMN